VTVRTGRQQREADLAEFVALLMEALEVEDVADAVTGIVMEHIRKRKMRQESRTVIPLTDSGRVRPPAPISARGQLKNRSPR